MRSPSNKMSRRAAISLLSGTAIVGGLGYAGYKTFGADTPKPKIKLAASIYVGWMPWFLADEDGTLARIGEEHGFDIDFVRADYADTLTLFGAGTVDAVVMTNIDAISTVAAAGIEADVILISSFSNGNDAVILKSGIGQNITGKTLGLVEFSVSHYLLDRYMEIENIPFKEVTTINMTDSAIASIFAANDQTFDGAVTWNPIVQEITNRFDANVVADSSRIPNEIADMLVISRKTLREHPDAATALLRTWFSITARMIEDPALLNGQLGELSGTDAAGYASQLDKTILVDDQVLANQFLNSETLPTSSRKILRFVHRHGLVETPPAGDWITYATDATPGLLNFNPDPLQALVK